MASGMLRPYDRYIGYVLPVFDALSAFVAAISVYKFYLGADSAMPLQYGLVLMVLPLVVPTWFSQFGVYRAWRGAALVSELIKLAGALVTLLSTLSLLALLSKTGEHFSRVWVVGTFVFMGLLTISSRVMVRATLSWLRKSGRNKRFLVIVGTEKGCEAVKKAIASHTASGLGVLSEYCLPEGECLDLERVCDDLRRAPVDQVWIACPVQQYEQVLKIQAMLGAFSVQVFWVPDFLGLDLARRKLRVIAGMPVMHLQKNPLEGRKGLIKSLEDKLLSGLILVAISPLMLLIAIAIKIDSKGPVLFKQVRHGWNNRPIEVYKFRTMVEHKESGVITSARKNDKRVTRLGRFLRKTSLDELPQFLNVLQGHMSIVGPRPHSVTQNDLFTSYAGDYPFRHRVKPGITGWAQVNGFRGEVDSPDKLKKRVEHDIYYINNWSLRFDIKIILMTIFKAWNQPNAY